MGPDQEVRWLTGPVLFSSARLSSSDFSDIAVGSPASAVAEIDPLTLLFRPEDPQPVTVQEFDFERNDYVERTYLPDPVLTYTDYHLLTDGILCITYARSDGDHDFTVSAIDLHENFQVFSEYSDRAVTLKVAAMDYPE